MNLCYFLGDKIVLHNLVIHDYYDIKNGDICSKLNWWIVLLKQKYMANLKPEQAE